MQTALYIYIFCYLLFSIWVVASDIKDKAPYWEILSGSLLLLLGFLGMLFYAVGITEPFIRTVWKGVSVLIILGQIILNIYTRHLTLKGKKKIDVGEISQFD